MRAVWMVLAMLALAVPARAEDDGIAVAMADVLFPQAAGWKAVSELRPLQRDEVEESREYIAAAAKPVNIVPEGAGCDFVKETLGPEADLSAWRWVDLDGDGSGEDDLLYAGLIPCAEGSMTLAFAWNGEAYEAQPQELALTRALRIKPGKEPELLSLSAGCCADPVNVYRKGTVSVPMATGPDFLKNNVTVIEGTVAPKRVLAEPEGFTTTSELIVRSSPEVKDEYDAGASEMMSHAMFGNQLRLYMKGAKGAIHARQQDAQGNMWLFVVVQGESEALMVSDPYSNAEGGFAGWAMRGKEN